MNASIDIVIVNWNSGRQLEETVSSIEKYHANLVESVVIVDNFSTDDSMDFLKKRELPFFLKIIRNLKNRGFGVACNQGAAAVTSEFILFLNPDARLFEDSLMSVVDFISRPENHRVGVVGVQLLDESGEVARSCGRFPDIGIFIAHALGINRLRIFAHLNIHMLEWKHDDTRVVDHVIGAFYLIRRTLFESLSGFDERFFVYLEDMDLSLRVHQAGYCSIYLANCQAFHAGGGTSRQVKVHRLFYSLQSRLLYGFKHFAPWKARVLVFVTLCIEPITRIVLSSVSGDWEGVRNTWKAYSMLIRSLRAAQRSTSRT